MAGDYGKIDVSAYASQRTTPGAIATLETAASTWLATRPGSFTSRDAVGLYDKARAKFEKCSGLSVGAEIFEGTLARLGYRAGVVVFDGAPFWILIPPSSLDGALDRMAAMESRA